MRQPLTKSNTPGYADLQVNGYAGVDYNTDGLSAEQLHTSCRGLRADGVDWVLATIITEDLKVMEKRIARLIELRERDELAADVIAGLHIEGPFINEQPGYRGAHPQDAIVPADPDAMKRLLDAAGGLTRIVTLAPERDSGLKTTRMLADQGITVSAGHCDASMDTLTAAIDAGLGMVTHLGNGCPMQMHRHDNIIQRVLSLSDRLWVCFIADGAHIPFPALGNYLKRVGPERAVIVTDAIAPAGMGPGTYTLGRWELVIGEDMVAWAPDHSHLVGSAINMPRSTQNLRNALGLDDALIDRLTRINPAASIGLDQTI